jgi:hypothetical protein
VSSANSLFDYAPGTSTATFTMNSWPSTQAPCTVPNNEPAKPLDPAAAAKYCADVADRQMRADCIFDVRVTGEPGFAKLYLATQKINAGVTTTSVTDMKNPTRVDEAAAFVATVAPRTSSGNGAPAGVVQFSVDGNNAGDPIKLDGGRATWRTTALKPGRHLIGAAYTPGAGSPFLGSRSIDIVHTVGGGSSVTISELNMQAGNETTPCPPMGTAYTRADAANVPYLRAALPGLDMQCSLKEAGLIATSVTFTHCAQDPRGTGFGPNARANITCGK